MKESLISILGNLDGIRLVDAEDAEIDKEDGGVFPASVSLNFSPDSLGFHAMEFIVWALGDMERAGANIRHHLRSPPPWLNKPGESMSLEVYIYPRSEGLSEEEALAEVAGEVEDMAAFISQVHEEYWPLCAPAHE